MNTQPGVYSLERTVEPWEYEIVRQYYEDILGELNLLKAKDIEWAMTNGLENTAVCDALEQTAMAPRPTHYYFRAILRRYVNHRILTKKDAEKERLERQRERAIAFRKNWSSWYSSPNDDDDLWF